MSATPASWAQEWLRTSTRRVPSRYARAFGKASLAPLLCFLSLLFFACSSPKPPESAVPTSSGPLTIHDFLPFENQTVLSFVTRDDLGGSSYFVMEIERPSEARGEIWIAGRRTRFQISPRRIERAEGGIWLAEPLEVGRSFPGPFGQTTIESVSERVTVPAGTFEGCVVTLERSEAKTAESTYCPGVGLVRLVVEGASDADVTRVQSELTSYGPRVDLRSP